MFDPEDLDSDGAFYDAHGTHVAGTVGARGNNGIGITGVNSNVKMMVLKFMGPGGVGIPTRSSLSTTQRRKVLRL